MQEIPKIKRLVAKIIDPLTGKNHLVDFCYISLDNYRDFIDDQRAAGYVVQILKHHTI